MLVINWRRSILQDLIGRNKRTCSLSSVPGGVDVGEDFLFALCYFCSSY